MLSKSRFLAGLQCRLRLWYQCYQPQLAGEISPGKQALFNTGHEVGRMATRLYPGGILIKEGYRRHDQAARSTAAFMQDAKTRALYEAAFVFEGVRVRVDILERADATSWNMIEVKSSTSVKKIYCSDVAVQHFVLRGCGVKLNTSGLLHLNNQYVYDGQELHWDSLFTFADLTEHVIGIQAEVADLLNDFNTMLAAGQAPDINPSRHCLKPYGCEFWDHCTQKMPEFWVLNLNGISQAHLSELAAEGVDDIRDIPDSFKMTGIQKRIQASVSTQKEYIDPMLESELNAVIYPVHFLDFETMGSAIPRYAGTKTYQAIPFQWSNHILQEDGHLEHQEYLCVEDKDPREDFARALLASLGNSGTIFIYTTYEKEVIRLLAERLPAYRKPLLDTLDRFKDLCDIIRKNYYHPKFHGSFSLKSVLPALRPEMSYKNLAIREGNQAALEYAQMIDSATSSTQKSKIRKDLLIYCGQDTLAMVRIRQELLKSFSHLN
jgi:predicted RecB family nuclease